MRQEESCINRSWIGKIAYFAMLAHAHPDEIQTDDAAVAVAVAADFVFLRFWKILIPAGYRVVVMCSGVADTVGCCKIVRMIITLIQSLKSKLKDLHTRERKLITQFFHFRSDHTKIFCPDRKILTELFLDSLEQFFCPGLFSIYRLQQSLHQPVRISKLRSRGNGRYAGSQSASSAF